MSADDHRSLRPDQPAVVAGGLAVDHEAVATDDDQITRAGSQSSYIVRS